ncbi:MAG: beta-lactamase family protein [Actinobacteria bacterium]|nr:MAG: beta-lactamase family protein [Actinomycetota bacterium]
MTRGFEAVAEEFDPGPGAAFAATVDGELVVDLWGGPGWQEDTLCLVFSGTKGFVAACLLLLVERGELELDAPLVRYWPEFSSRRVLVRHVVSHTTGLPGMRPPPTMEELLDGERAAARLAQQTPFWEPGTRLAYHALTYGFFAGELVGRIDGRSVGTFFAEEIAAPLGLDLWIGLPPELEPRVARLVRGPGYGASSYDADPELLAAVYGPMFESFSWNDPALHAAEIPAANGIGTARSIAQLYGSLDRILKPETERLGRSELSRDRCAITQRPYAFGVGFELQTELGRFGPPPAAFGHTGSGGSTHGYWPEERVGFSYVPSELRPEPEDDRGRRMLAALHACV